jgi:hypothetical protein
MAPKTSTMAIHMTLKDAPFRYKEIVFWTAYDVYEYVLEEYGHYIRQGQMTEEGVTAVAIHEALYARCRYLASMRNDVNGDPYVVWGDQEAPDLSNIPDSRAKHLLEKHWHQFVVTAATACARESRRHSDL